MNTAAIADCFNIITKLLCNSLKIHLELFNVDSIHLNCTVDQISRIMYERIAKSAVLLSVLKNGKINMDLNGPVQDICKIYIYADYMQNI